MNLIQQLEKEQVAKLSAGKEMPDFGPGDTVLVNYKVVEGERTRIQAYEGVCIGRAGAGLNENFTVRKISYGEGVERVFPLYSPMIELDQGRPPRQGAPRQALLSARPPRQGGAHLRETGPPRRRERGGGEGGGIVLRGWFLTAGLLVASTAVAAAEPLSIEIARAQVGFDPRTNEPVISFRMSEASKRVFADFTTKNVGRKVEIRVDGRALMAPVIREPILGGMGQIAAGLKLDEPREAHVRILGDAGLVVGDGDHRHVVFLDQRQDGLQPILLAGDGIDQRPAVGDLQPRLQRRGHRESIRSARRRGSARS